MSGWIVFTSWIVCGMIFSKIPPVRCIPPMDLVDPRYPLGVAEDVDGAGMAAAGRDH
jgi:hypothetical protein